jgi:hypothetical protein
VIASAARPASAAHVESATTAMPPHGWNTHGLVATGISITCLTPFTARGLLFVVRRDSATDDGRARDHGDQHVGQRDVGAEARGAGDVRHAVEQRAGLGSLTWASSANGRGFGSFGTGQLRGGPDDVLEVERPLGRRMHDLVVRDHAGLRA